MAKWADEQRCLIQLLVCRDGSIWAIVHVLLFFKKKNEVKGKGDPNERRQNVSAVFPHGRIRKKSWAFCVKAIFSDNLTQSVIFPPRSHSGYEYFIENQNDFVQGRGTDLKAWHSSHFLLSHLSADQGALGRFNTQDQRVGRLNPGYASMWQELPLLNSSDECCSERPFVCVPECRWWVSSGLKHKEWFPAQTCLTLTHLSWPPAVRSTQSCLSYKYVSG